jgi:signal transduction histidine kinase
MVRRRDKKEFDRLLASWSGRLWLEVKALITLLDLIFLVSVLNISLNWGDLFSGVLNVTIVSCALLLGLWWFYLMAVDLAVNGKTVFSHNLLNSVIKQYRKYESRFSWQRAMLKRVYVLLAAEALLAFIAVLFLLTAMHEHEGGLSFLLAVLITSAGLYLIYRYLRQYNHTVDDLGRLVEHIELMKTGDMQTRLELSPDADMYPAAQNLNSIQEGMSIAVAEKIKSERMKIDLITNVSHDLKTPLTSIISYVDLLAQEQGLPEHVNDYVKILGQKSERLKHLIQDLFDLSKASSDNLALDMEKIDLARLIHQALGDMEEQINASGLVFRLNIPDQAVYIYSDGKKLYRVWENLIANALKYSLSGSRVFVDLTVNHQTARATIKNTANYEMNFNEEEILQRFVRGDESRTTEGSGLGLSIAQSFTQICGGTFNITIDGDLFKVELGFNQAK